jgi:hypothetical protein
MIISNSKIDPFKQVNIIKILIMSTENTQIPKTNQATSASQLISASAWGRDETDANTEDVSNMDFIFTPPSPSSSYFNGITQLLKEIVKPFYTKNTSILDNFGSEIESIRIFEYNKAINSMPGPAYIGPEIRGRKIHGGSAYVVVYHFKSSGSYFWQPDMIEFHNYKGAMSLSMSLEYAGWKMTMVDHMKELEKEVEILLRWHDRLEEW